MTNKEVVLKFYDEVFNGWCLDNIDTYMHDDYIQHNPNAEDGKAGFLKFAAKFLSMKPHMDIKLINAEDDMVYVMFKCTLENGIQNKVCDIYRLKDGKLAEHWDIIEHNIGDITPVHNNGLF